MILGAIFLFLTCTKDDEPQGEEAIAGQWVLRSLMINGIETTIEGGDTTFSQYFIQGLNYRTQINFSLDPNQYTSFGKTTIRLNQINGNSIEFNSTDSLGFVAGENGTWSINGNNFFFNPGTSESIELNYSRINRTAFRLAAALNDTSRNGNSTVITVSDLEMIFRK